MSGTASGSFRGGLLPAMDMMWIRIEIEAAGFRSMIPPGVSALDSAGLAAWITSSPDTVLWLVEVGKVRVDVASVEL